MSPRGQSSFLRSFAALAATAFLLGGCNDSSPTEPLTAMGTPTPVPANIAGDWAGRFEGYGCDASAWASFQQSGASFRGRLWTSDSCRQSFSIWEGGVNGNTFDTSTTDADGNQGVLRAVLSGSTLEVTLDNYFGTAHVHLHR